jgi:hypothetical protein
MSVLSRVAAWLVAFALSACGGTIGDIEGLSPGANGAAGGGSATGVGGAGGTEGLNNLPARIRRLTSYEYDAAVGQLFGTASTFGATFSPDARQDGFTMNDAPRVDPVFAMQAAAAAEKLAAGTKMNLAAVAPCAPSVASDESCARAFIDSFAARAYRRPLVSREVEALLALYRTARAGASYADGIEVVVQAILQSPEFLYVTEIGETPRAPLAKLTPHETANAIAFLMTGAPPDDPLRSAAASGEIASSEARTAQAKRLFASAGSNQMTRVVEEWLGIDRIAETAKDSNVYPDFQRLKDAMKQEADDFIAEVMWRSQGTIADLLSEDWTIASDDLARMYYGGAAVPARTNGRVSLAGIRRRGVLNQAAFLSVYAHATETAPVLRGVAVLRRLACIDVPSPASLNINVVPPVPDPAKTTRERFATHATDPVCAACHTNIDAFGFSFENMDGMGKERTDEAGRPVDSSAAVAVAMDFDGTYRDSSELVTRMATSSAVRACFARHLFRYAAARSDKTVAAAERAFVNGWNGMPNAGSLGDLLVAWVGSDAFVERRADP